MKKITIILATGFGLGFSPVASGTVGSILGVGIVIAMQGLLLPWQIALAVVLSILAIPLCDAAEKIFQAKDDGRIVADEFMTFPICMLGITLAGNYWMLAIAFATNRILDIIKPAPAMQAQSLPGGLGIVTDDVISSLYALGANHLIFWLVKQYVLLYT